MNADALAVNPALGIPIDPFNPHTYSLPSPRFRCGKDTAIPADPGREKASAAGTRSSRVGLAFDAPVVRKLDLPPTVRVVVYLLRVWCVAGVKAPVCVKFQLFTR